MSNYVGILSEGLRIAPPSAPATGYMFGKGVYFADMVSKSANYCFTSQSNNTGFLLLADVALGNMQPRTQAFFVERLPSGMVCASEGCTFVYNVCTPNKPGPYVSVTLKSHFYFLIIILIIIILSLSLSACVYMCPSVSLTFCLLSSSFHCSLSCFSILRLVKAAPFLILRMLKFWM